MKRDRALLDAAERGEAGWRVYTWDGVWVSLGRNQSPTDVLVSGAFPWVQRPTGGAAVLHGHDVTFSCAFPLSDVSGGRLYRVVTAPLLAAVEACGVLAVIAGGLGTSKEYAAFADCFATTTRNDIVDPATGHKICGCALRRTRGGVLLQASIPVGVPCVEPDQVIVGGVRGTAVRLTAEDLARAVEREFGR